MTDKLLSKFIIPVLYNTTWQTYFYPNSLSLLYTTQHGRQTSIQIHYPCFYTTQHDGQTSIQIHYPWFIQHNMADKLLSKFIIPALHNPTWQTDFYPNSLSLFYTTQHDRQTSIQIHYPCFTQHNMADRLLSKFIIPVLHNTT